jgi:hypothetical protein
MLTQADQEQLEYLLNEYKQKKAELYELQADTNIVRDNLILFFQVHGIKEKEYQNKIFKLYKHISYTYPESCKAHLKIKPSKNDCIKMLNKSYKTRLK